ncbi:MAG: alpha/beta hydrolase [Oscillospiraceae bacterium]|nr:alpha/beta hydrolase [Oscillospiraceae bacterium]
MQKTLLILHGWGCDESVYAIIAKNEKLCSRYRVILPELPGFGKTPEPPEPWGVSEYAEYVAYYCKTNDISPDVLLCHSLGCRIALKLLSGEVENGLSPQKVVFTGAAGIRPKLSTTRKAKIRLFKLKKALLKPFPKALERMRQKYGSEDYRNATPVMRQCLVKIVNEDLTKLLPKVPHETLLIWGENDDSTPLSDGKLMERLMPNAGLAVIKNAGHYAFLEQSRLFMQILDSYI